MERLPGGEQMLVMRLVDSSLRDVFLSLCEDIADAVEQAESESAAVAVAVARTWRWYHLLRGGSRGPLSPEEQKGLIGELLVLERYLIPAVGVAGAIDAWVGPMGGAQDFRVSGGAIESKACTDTPNITVRISSEFQLDDKDRCFLFLHLTALARAQPGEDGAMTLADVVGRVRLRVEEAGGAPLDRFDSLLAAAGFHSAHDYTAQAWRSGERGVYRVGEGFPRLTATALPAGVVGLSYGLQLPALGSFLVEPSALEAALTAGIR